MFLAQLELAIRASSHVLNAILVHVIFRHLVLRSFRFVLYHFLHANRFIFPRPLRPALLAEVLQYPLYFVVLARSADVPLPLL